MDELLTPRRFLANGRWRKVTLDHVRLAIPALWAELGRAPTYREISHVLGLGNNATVIPYLRELEARGEVEREPGAGTKFAPRAVWPTGFRAKVRALAGAELEAVKARLR